MRTLEDLAQRFDSDRQHLKSVVLHLLGSVADAEDAVQSAWLKASRADHATIENLTGWFTTITAREAVDQLRARKRRAEQQLTDPDALDRASRARGRLHAGASAQPKRTSEHIEIVQAFLDASRGGDIHTLLDLLAPEVVRTVDRALVPDDVPTELRGAKEVAEETRRFAMRARAGVVVLIDGVPGIAVAPAGRVAGWLQIGIEGGRIHTIDIVGDGERLESAVMALPPYEKPGG
jgi:DNA-directed RNA polymerase specialized sigma24 family protein